jgi:hypothetical protein
MGGLGDREIAALVAEAITIVRIAKMGGENRADQPSGFPHWYWEYRMGHGGEVKIRDGCGGAADGATQIGHVPPPRVLCDRLAREGRWRV